MLNTGGRDKRYQCWDHNGVHAVSPAVILAFCSLQSNPGCKDGDGWHSVDHYAMKCRKGDGA